MKSNKSLERKIDILSKMLGSFEKKLAKTNSKIDDLAAVIAKGVLQQGRSSNFSRRSTGFRAETERFGEQGEHLERTLNLSALSNIRGRHREILALLINSGFHTYKQIAKKLNISQSRARAYIAELKNQYNLPLTQIRDAEGYKVGIEVRFVEQILSK
jgi:DNA-binding CsgD family transcriptional regulator